ncbi:MAG: hypothetical protein KBS81_06085, partial [Spirochaetales bacterium]|nr:hypothetical protein [Candidatus Physcosoma equi]
MTIIRNFPFFSIILSMFCCIISSVIRCKKAGYISVFLTSLVLCLSGATLFYALETGESITYMMGHFPAPWGNEIRSGSLEA